MRLPSKFGSVYKLKGRRHHPWAARKTVGYNEKGHALYFYVGYFKTRTEAVQALSRYNANPFERGKTTFGEVFELYSKEAHPDLSRPSVQREEIAYRKLEPLYKRPISEITLAELKSVCGMDARTESELAAMKLVLSKTFKFAAQNEIISPEKSHIISYLKLKPSKEGRVVKRSVFTREEIAALQKIDADIVIMLIYSGVRIMELLDLKKEDVHIEDRYFSVRHAKTSAGVRDVPIAEKALPYWEKRMSGESEYVIARTDFAHVYQYFLRNTFQPWMKSIGASHTCHDTRHTCVSMLTEAGVDGRIIDAIVGHVGNSMAEKVYTHISMETKLEAINSI